MTSTCQSVGMQPSRCLSSPSQWGRQLPFSCPPSTFHATGIAQLRITTLIDKIVQRSPSVVASSTSTICRFPVPRHLHDPPQQGSETGGHIQFSPLFSAFVLRIQIPLAQALKHPLFLLVQHQREQSTELRNPCCSR